MLELFMPILLSFSIILNLVCDQVTNSMTESYTVRAKSKTASHYRQLIIYWPIKQ